MIRGHGTRQVSAAARVELQPPFIGSTSRAAAAMEWSASSVAHGRPTHAPLGAAGIARDRRALGGRHIYWVPWAC